MTGTLKKQIASPKEIKALFPLTKEEEFFLQQSREIAKKSLITKNKLVIVIGPCSVHDEESTLEYATRLKELSSKLKNFFIVMRVFVEKSRSNIGWKGFVHDPKLDNSCNLEEGIKRSRKLFLELTKLKMPISMEILSPLLIPYLEDLLTWGFVGARTVTSQIHRQLASRLPFPVGFKNSLDGNIESALDGAQTASFSNSFLDLNDEGKIVHLTSQGNPYTHIVLRGSQKKGNFTLPFIQKTQLLMQQKNFSSALFIDCSHGNSLGQATKQKKIFKSALSQVENISGVMLESHLKGGKQLPSKALVYGRSITDECLDFESSKELLIWGDQLLSNLSKNDVSK
jgi:3-deoxy-7-phosphoheptulonate synthase